MKEKRRKRLKGKRLRRDGSELAIQKKMAGIEFGMGVLEKVGGALYLLVACSSAGPVIGGQDDVVPEAAAATNLKSGSLQVCHWRSLNSHCGWLHALYFIGPLMAGSRQIDFRFSCQDLSVFVP